jgi:hypothetical protein
MTKQYEVTLNLGKRYIIKDYLFKQGEPRIVTDETILDFLRDEKEIFSKVVGDQVIEATQPKFKIVEIVEKQIKAGKKKPAEEVISDEDIEEDEITDEEDEVVDLADIEEEIKAPKKGATKGSKKA